MLSVLLPCCHRVDRTLDIASTATTVPGMRPSSVLVAVVGAEGEGSIFDNPPGFQGGLFFRPLSESLSSTDRLEACLNGGKLVAGRKVPFPFRSLFPLPVPVTMGVLCHLKIRHGCLRPSVAFYSERRTPKSPKNIGIHRA
jgi:hypothetical protein